MGGNGGKRILSRAAGFDGSCPRANSIPEFTSRRPVIGTRMRIVYLADTQIPSRATNGMQIMRMCAAFAANGADVTLVHPHRFGNRPEGYDGDLWSFYGVSPAFEAIALPTALTLRLSAHRRFARTSRALPLSVFVFWRSRPAASPFVVYSRSMLGTWLTLKARAFWRGRSSCRGIFVELHDTPRTEKAREVVRRADGVVAISRALRDHVVAVLPDVEPRIAVEHDGVDLDRFAQGSVERSEARRRLRLDEQTTIVGYTGRVNADKGFRTLVEAARRLQGQPVSFLIVGKVYDGLEATIAGLESVTLTGFVPPSDVPAYVSATDILVMPTSARITYAAFTSPLKLFEYMASGRPLICSDLPVLTEVVRDGENALLVPADNPSALARAIEKLVSSPELGRSLAKAARADAAYYDWACRAERILSFIASPR